MNVFSFPSNTAKKLSLTTQCSAGTSPDLVKAIYAHLAKLPISICRLSLCWWTIGGQQWEKRGRLQSIQRLPLPMARGGEEAFLKSLARGMVFVQVGQIMSTSASFLAFATALLDHLGSVHQASACTDTAQTSFSQSSPETPYSHWEWPPKLVSFPLLQIALKITIPQQCTESPPDLCVLYRHKLLS